jgi:hypothetical protein
MDNIDYSFGIGGAIKQSHIDTDGVIVIDEFDLYEVSIISQFMTADTPPLPVSLNKNTLTNLTKLY